jgi:hypothetical protein
MFPERGSTNKIYTFKSTDTVKQMMDWMIQKYGINTIVNAPLTCLDPDTITIPRIVACFPAKICEYYHNGFGNSLVTFRDVGLSSGDGISRSILCPHFAAIIPKEFIRLNNSKHFVSFLVHIVVDDMLHKKQDIFTYYCADFNSPGTPEEG